MRAEVQRLLSDLTTQSADTWETLLVLGSLLEKAFTENADDNYRLEELGDRFCVISLSPAETHEILSALTTMLYAGPAASRAQVLWAIGKVWSQDGFSVITNFLYREQASLTEDESYQALIGLENIASSPDSINSFRAQHGILEPIFAGMSRDGPSRLQEIAGRLLRELANEGKA